MHNDHTRPGHQPSIRSLRFVQDRLSAQVARALRAALSSGDLRPGVVYSAPTLAAEFGVSATPVREAMVDLAREGLVEIVRYKGFRVIEPTGQDLAEYTEIRALIEAPTVGRVTGTATGEQLAALRPLARETVAAAERDDLAAYLEADDRFHLALLGLTGNTRLVETVAELCARSRPHRRLPAEGLLPAARQHLELLDLMVAGQAQAAQAGMDDHLRGPEH
jgi:DNA-binding GntR family transcriptional regulator